MQHIIKNKGGVNSERKTVKTFVCKKHCAEGGALEMIVKDKSQVGGPLNQFSTIGYKFETNGATILYPERMLCMWSCSSYSGIDEANYDQTFFSTVNPYATTV